MLCIYVIYFIAFLVNVVMYIHVYAIPTCLTLLCRWCRAHFGEVFSGWMHLKVVTAFVESVLRYGLPVDVLTVFVEPNMRREKQVQDNLSKTIARMRSDLVAEVGEDEDEKSENSSEVLPYVCLKFGVAGGSGN